MWVLLLLPAVCPLAVFLHSLHTGHSHTREHLFVLFFDYFSSGSECKFAICSSVYVDVQHPTDYLISIFESSHSLGPLSLSLLFSRSHSISRTSGAKQNGLFFSDFISVSRSLHFTLGADFRFKLILLFFLRFLSAVVDWFACECSPVAVSSPNKRQPIILRSFFRFALFVGARSDE